MTAQAEQIRADIRPYQPGGRSRFPAAGKIPSEDVIPKMWPALKLYHIPPLVINNPFLSPWAGLWAPAAALAGAPAGAGLNGLQIPPPLPRRPLQAGIRPGLCYNKIQASPAGHSGLGGAGLNRLTAAGSIHLEMELPHGDDCQPLFHCFNFGADHAHTQPFYPPRRLVSRA